MFIVFGLITLGYCGLASGVCTEGKPDGNGVKLLGTAYDCKYLRQYFPEDKYVGIFQERKYHCRQPHTDCCETCAKVLSCVDAPNNGIYLAESYFNCSYLLKYYPEDKHVGIYENRKFICQQGTTDCCESCEKVLAGKEGTSTAPTQASTTSKPSRRPTTTQPDTYIDTCKDSCLWIADGNVGKCSWLLDPTRPEYNSRIMICKNGMAEGCKGTCHEVLEGRETVITEVKSSSSVCEDSYIMVEKMSYPCGDLLRRDSPLYNNRQPLCKTNNKACCITCTRVSNEKRSGEIKYSEQNQIDKQGDTNIVIAADLKSYDTGREINNQQRAQSGKSKTKVQPHKQYGLMSFLENMKNTLEDTRSTTDQNRRMFTQMLSNIMAMFKNMQSADGK